MKFSKKVSIAALALLVVLLTSFTYSYWKGGFTVGATDNLNTLPIQVGQAAGGELEIDFKAIGEVTKGSLVPANVKDSSITNSSTTETALVTAYYQLYEVRVSLKGANSKPDFSVSIDINAKNHGSIFNTKAIVIESNQAGSYTDKINRRVDLSNEFGDKAPVTLNSILQPGKTQTVLVQVTMNEPATEEEYNLIANKTIDLTLVATVSVD